MIVWRRREDNPWIHDAELLVKQMVPVVSHEETDQVHLRAWRFLSETLPKVAAYNLTRVMNIVGIKPLIAAIAA